MLALPLYKPRTGKKTCLNQKSPGIQESQRNSVFFISEKLGKLFLGHFSKFCHSGNVAVTLGDRKNGMQHVT